MIDFVVKNGELVEFIKRAICKGTIKVNKTAVVTGHFFKNFYLEAVDDRIEIKSIDSESRKVYAYHILKNVDVKENGKFPVTNSLKILRLLKFIPSKRMIRFTYDGTNPLTITTEDSGPFKGFELKESFALSEDNINLYKKKAVKFVNAHYFNEEGYPVIAHEGKEAVYSMHIPFSKRELDTIISQTTDLTFNQDILMNVSSDGTTQFKSTRKSAKIKSNDIFNERAKNPIQFSAEFSNLQPIIPQLFNKIDFYMRKASDGIMKLWIQSKEGNIELNFATGA